VHRPSTIASQPPATHLSIKVTDADLRITTGFSPSALPTCESPTKLKQNQKTNSHHRSMAAAQMKQKCHSKEHEQT
jgi:hypothetical protein